MKLRISGMLGIVAAAIVCCEQPVVAVSAAPTLITLVTFNGTNGEDPTGALIADATGNLFGTTSGGGANSNGTVFEVAKTAGGYASIPTILYSFCAEINCTDGRDPLAGLLADTAGNLFGTTCLGTTIPGGANFGGTVFELVNNGGSSYTFKTLANFNGINGPSSPCANAVLIADASGNLFGTLAAGGPLSGSFGGVFEIAKIPGGYASSPTILYSFCAKTNCTDGANPAGLFADADGNLFGTTTFGGATNDGTVFELVNNGGGSYTLTTLVTFNGSNGANPNGTLIADAAGNLFGTTSGGANTSCGTSYSPAGGCGAVFEIARTAGGYASTPTLLYSFCAQTNCTDGASPVAGLLSDADGNLFGTTAFGGLSNGLLGAGTVFEIAKTAGGYAASPTILYSFCAKTNCTDGEVPEASLLADASGNLFGTAAFGGVNAGTLFEITNSGFVTGPALLPPSEIATTASGLAYSRVSRTFNGTVRITNISGSPISGPFSILLTALTTGVTLANATGSFFGSPYLMVPTVASLAAGQSATVGVEFNDPSFGPINFTPAVYSGSL
jgi:uncharacterized repeat protein (TIGR03803 family)